MLHPFHEALDSTYTGWLSRGALIGLNAGRKVAKSGDNFDGRKIEITSSGMLHSRVPGLLMDLEMHLSFFWVGLLKKSGGLVAARQHFEKACNFASHSAFALFSRSFPTELLYREGSHIF